MRTFGSMSIRSQIVAMMILMATAMFGLITYIGVKQRNHDLNEVRELTTRFTRQTASEINELAAGTELLLGIISRLPGVQQHNAPAVDPLLANIIRQSPRYANLIVTDKMGLVWSSAVPFKGTVSTADRRYFINGISTGRFSSGEYMVGRITASPVMVYGLPIKGASGEIAGLAAAVIRPERYRELLRQQRLPEGSTILLVDHRGMVLYHSLLPQLIGKPDRAALFRQMKDGPDEGSFPSPDDDQSYSFSHYRKLWLAGERTPYMYVRVTIPYDTALDNANNELIVNILLMSSLVLLVIGIASYISKRYIIDKIHSLQDAAQKIARGDLGVRIAEDITGGELGALGHAFDDMAHALAQDSAERKRVLEALRRSEASLSRAQEIAHLGNWEFDTGTGKIVWSDEAYRIFGFAPREVEITADLFLGMIHPEDRNKIEKALGGMRGGLGQYDVEYRIIRRDGSVRYVHSRRYALIVEEEPGKIFGMVQDITERRKMDQELLKAQKLESIGVLAGGIAHDFNNLLGGVFGYIEMAKVEAEDRNQKEIDQCLSKAMSVFDKAKELTQQLLTFSKGGAPILKTQSIAGLLRRAVSFTLSGSNTHPNFSIPDDLWLTEFDETQMAQVFDNIAVNAREAMPQGGTIDVTAQNMPADGGPETGPQKPFVLISLRDHGTGIAPEHLPHIFDPFFTTKLQGSGLGLSTSYSIIKQHGGRIEVDSERGKGTTFRIYLPASTAPAPAAKKGETLALPFRSEQRRVLVMDDERFILDIAATLLKKMGYDAVTASNGDEAITKTAEAMQSGRRFVAAILDLTIPGGRGGKETVPALVRIDPEMKVIVSSGYSDDLVIARPAEYGFSGRLIKPYRRDEMAQLFRSLFGDAS